jgi:hypothetical protein
MHVRLHWIQYGGGYALRDGPALYSPLRGKVCCDGVMWRAVVFACPTSSGGPQLDCVWGCFPTQSEAKEFVERHVDKYLAGLESA